MSYSHHDERWLRRIQVHLAPLVRQKAVEIWSDTRLAAGDPWRREIERAIQQAGIALLLVSPDFLASDFIAKNELPPLLSRAQADGLSIMWLAVSHSLYMNTEIERYQALNDPSRPLSGLRGAAVDKVLVSACQAISAVSTRHFAETLAHGEAASSVASRETAGLETQFWSAVERYRINAPIGLVKSRVAVDKELAAAKNSLPISRLSKILDDAPNDGEIQMAVAVLLGVSPLAADEKQVSRMLIQLLRSPFERARFRSAVSIKRCCHAQAPSEDVRSELEGALLGAIFREDSQIVQACMLSALATLQASGEPLSDGGQ